MAVMISAAQRRFLVLASTVFFVSSLYFCVSRLVGMSYEPVKVEPKPQVEIEINKADLRMSYGKYHRPGYDGITLSGALPDQYIPTKENGRRLIVIGDIHGMLDPLNDLLKKTKFDPKNDHVISVGDMVNKGPKSTEVVQRLMDLNATAVRGNHEDRVLLAWHSINAQIGAEALLDNAHEALRRGRDKDLATARRLSASQIEWLRGLPVLLTIDPLAICIVHAGLVPGLPIASQDPWAMMNMRTLRFPREEFRVKEEAKKKKKLEEEKKKEEERLKKLQGGHKRSDEAGAANVEILQLDQGSPTFVSEEAKPKETVSSDPIENLMSNTDHDVMIPVDNRDGEPWSEIWNWSQRKLSSKLRRTIIYGHDAKLGYQETTYTYGLDSSCVKGHALTALVISAGEGADFNRTTIQVVCKEPKKGWW